MYTVIFKMFSHIVYQFSQPLNSEDFYDSTEMGFLITSDFVILRHGPAVTRDLFPTCYMLKGN